MSNQKNENKRKREETDKWNVKKTRHNGPHKSQRNSKKNDGNQIQKKDRIQEEKNFDQLGYTKYFNPVFPSNDPNQIINFPHASMLNNNGQKILPNAQLQYLKKPQ